MAILRGSLVLLGFMLALLYGCGENEPAVTLSEHTTAAKPPNILFILADDLGFSDLGAFGSEIPTPNLDGLAHQGLLLTNMYAGPTCSPTRAMLFSGTDSHLAGLGVMDGSQRPEHEGQPGYAGYLNFQVASLADLLSDAGYNTYMTGKWHLGKTVETGPAARGFKQSFVSLDGAAHLGKFSWNDDGTDRYRDGTELVTVGDDFYSTRFYTRRMIEYIDSDRAEGKPFFAFLAYTAPHWPLQAPAESIAKFHGQYDAGYDVLYQQRLERLRQLGFIPEANQGAPRLPGQPAWEALSQQEQQIEARKMEVYAAMVNDLDHYVGEVIDYLKAIGEFDNTFILFMSDNGAEGQRRDLVGPLKAWVEECCDNSLENLGQGDSYIMYGPNWARVSGAPFNHHKATAYEGGVHVPAFVHYPALGRAGERLHGLGSIIDVLPTFLELAGAQHPGTTYRGKAVLPVTGKSLLPMLRGEVASVYDNTSYLGWELYRHQGIRQGDWKIVWDPREGDEARWRLYNLAEDISEQNDLAAVRPDKLAAMIALWEDYHASNQLIP
jgi:arylsulfatase